MTSPFELASPWNPTVMHPSDLECQCKDPDDQYLMEIDGGAVYLTHKACGKQPGEWLDGTFSMARIPVTLHWHDYQPAIPEDDWGAHGMVTVNARSVLHDDVPYLVGRDYADREGGVWHITDQVNAQGEPLVYLLPEGAGVDVALPEIVADFGPLTLTPVKENATS